MAEENQVERSKWVDQAKIRPAMDFHSHLGCTFYVILIPATILALVFTKSPLIVIPIAIALAIVAARIRTHIFYNRIRCPKCLFNPTRRKSDDQPRQDIAKVHTQLERYTECPRCGDTGDRS